MSLPCVILAAGRSSRMGQAKALLPLDGSNFVNRLADTCLRSCRPVIVVLGSQEQAIRRTLPRNPNIVPVANPDYECGMLSSLQAGLAALPKDACGAVFTLVDHPRLQLATLQAVIDKFQRSGAPVVIPRFEGKRGHPVAVSAAVVRELIETPKTGSPKDVIHTHRESTAFVDLDDPAIVEDIDTPEDYERIVQEGTV